MNGPVRVLQVLGGLDAGGSEAFVMNLYRAINKDKIQFDFIKHVEYKGIFENEIRKLGGKIFICPKYNGKNHFSYCKWWNHFFQQHPEYKIIHGHVRSTSAIYLSIARKYGLKTIAHSHSTSNGKGFTGIVKNVMQYPTRYIADYLFACSDKAGAWMFGKKAINQSNYRKVPNGIELRRFAFDDARRAQMRNKLGIGQNTFVIGHIGRMTVPKNHKFLIEIFAKYYQKNPNSKLLLIGDGELFQSIQLQCKQLGVSNAVMMMGSKINTEDYYQAMDAFAFPSLWEGLGIVLLEAQANGLSCIASTNIPEEAIRSKNVAVLDLKAKEKWIDSLLNIHVGVRVSASDKLQAYDNSNIAKQLQYFYLKQIGEK